MLDSRGIEQLFERLSRQRQETPVEGSYSISGELIEASIDFLGSDSALESLRLDPYWPKWNSPWWQMLLLFEMNMAGRIPALAIEMMCELLDTHYLKFFPFKEEQIPAGKDPYRHIACHCALGTISQVLTAAGVNVDKRLPWVRPWFIKYQMQDGGLNCDEAAYSKAAGKSSVVSTLPAVEAMLFCDGRELTEEENLFVDRGAQYLIHRKIFCSGKTGQPIDQSWYLLCFPRFYHFDALRGLSFLLKWSRIKKKPLPLNSIIEVLLHIEKSFPDGQVETERSSWKGAPTRLYDPSRQEWCKGESAGFPLLESVSAPGQYSPFLTKIWQAALSDLFEIKAAGLLV